VFKLMDMMEPKVLFETKQAKFIVGCVDQKLIVDSCVDAVGLEVLLGESVKEVIVI
jgi:hypothetical protein